MLGLTLIVGVAHWTLSSRDHGCVREIVRAQYTAGPEGAYDYDAERVYKCWWKATSEACLVPPAQFPIL